MEDINDLAYFSLRKLQRFVKEVQDDPATLKKMAAMVNGDDPILSMRASWALVHVSIINPKAIRPLLPQLFKFLRKTGQHTGAIRSVIRIMHEIEVPEKYCSELFDICIAYVKNATLPHAVRAFSLVTLGLICQRFPELKPEVELVLAELGAFPQPPSITSSMRKTSKILLKL